MVPVSVKGWTALSLHLTPKMSPTRTPAETIGSAGLHVLALASYKILQETSGTFCEEEEEEDEYSKRAQVVKNINPVS